MTTYSCTTQAELDAALLKAKPADLVVCVGSGYFEVKGQSTVRAYDQSTVRASGQSTVHAYDQSTVSASGQSTVSASGQSTVHAYDQSTVSASGQSTVHAYDQSTVSASGQSTVRAYDQSTVRASKFVTITSRGSLVSVEGGVLIPNPATAQEWCDFHGASVDGDHAILFKAVRDDYRSAHGMRYAPGTTPSAPDWDGGVAECGGGLHFVAHPWEGIGFDSEATRFVACPVLLSEIVVHSDPDFPNKVKAPRVALPCWECDIDGKAIAAKAVTA